LINLIRFQEINYNMYYFNNKIFLTEKDNHIVEEENKIKTDEGKVFYLKYINEDYKSSKGGNSSVFILYEKGTTEEYVIKISNYAKPNRRTPKKKIRRHGRFINEIKALYKIQEDKYLAGYVIKVLFDGEIGLNGYLHPYYVMEKADTDLKEYILNKEYEIDEQEKFKLCYDVLLEIKKLHHHGYYHRDIKPDNVFLFKEGTDEETTFRWKIGDLGLIAERDKDYDDLGEKIGPFGWVSPEAMNKYLTEKYNLEFDCRIDDRSDVFQLGGLFWFIFNNNAPIGIIVNEDFNYGNKDLFDIIYIMLTYKKNTRFNLSDVEEFLMPICQKYGVT